ncbi:MAG: aspartyl/asparaginyl beta-hydroxylase domain-containing protein [Burkholderiales bacterium]|nr:aspartyl/asparaginyl beta-hydroxylase domain-containing protein [Burkholderiales bacterium]
MGLRYWRLPFAFDAAAMQAELERLPAAGWPVHFNTGYHDGGWSGLALVSSDGDATRLYVDAAPGQTGVATPLLQACPTLRSVIETLPGATQSARLLRLAPGAVIREHRDDGIGIEAGTVRLHVPIVTDPEVEFYLDGVRVVMAAGECWYLDFGLPHRVQNHSARERIHLVVDCVLDERLRALLPDAGAGEALVRAQVAPQTSQQRFERFRERVLADPALQAELRRHADFDALARAAQEAGAAGGLRFTVEDVRAAFHAGRRIWLERHLV